MKRTVLRVESLKDFLAEALQERLERLGPGDWLPKGWRSVFGKACREEVEPVSEIITEEFERINPDEWR